MFHSPNLSAKNRNSLRVVAAALLLLLVALPLVALLLLLLSQLARHDADLGSQTSATPAHPQRRDGAAAAEPAKDEHRAARGRLAGALL